MTDAPIPAAPSPLRAAANAVPNALTILRLAVALVFPWLPVPWRAAAIVAAGLSDLLDGLICRALHAETVTGRILDPIADKTFVVMTLGTLLADGTLAAWQVVLVGARDLAVLGGAGWLVLRRGWSQLRELPPRWSGKLATAAQFVFLVVVASRREVVPVLFYVTAGLSLLAGADYLRSRR